MKALLLLAGGGLALAFLLPNHYPPWAAFQAEAMAALAVAPLAMWSASRRRYPDLLVLGVLALSLVPLLQFVFGLIQFAGDAWIAWLYISGFGLAVHCGACLTERSTLGSRSLEVLVPIQVGVLAASLISTLLAARQWLDLGFVSDFVIEKAASSRPYANLAQPNQLATLLMLGLAATIFLHEVGKVRAWLAIVAALILAFGLAMTQSRTAMLGGGLLWIAVLSLYRRANLRPKVVALGVTTAFYGLLMWAWPYLESELLLSRESTLSERMNSDLRIVLWRSMFDAVALHPWGGWGWGQVSMAQQAIALDHPATHWWFESAHNLFLDLAVWAGVPIALLVSSGLLAWFYQRIRNCCDPLSWSVLLGIGFVFCHAMVEFPLAYAYLLLPTGLLMGALSAATSTPENSSTSRTLSTASMTAMVMAVAVVAVSAYSKAVVEYLALEQEWRDLRLSRALVGAEQPPPVGGILLLTQLQARANFLRIAIKPNMDQSQIDWMGRVAQRYGTVNFMFPYAQALALNGRMPEAKQELAIMCKTQAVSACQRAQVEWARFESSIRPNSSALQFDRTAAP